MNCFFLFKFLLQTYSKFDFFSFGQDLGSGELFFSIHILITKVFKKVFFSFWQHLGFGECFCSIQILIKKYSIMNFFSFWQDLGFGELLFFYLDSYYKSIQTLIFSAFGKILVLANAKF